MRKHDHAVYAALKANDYKWPDHLTSGIMFYDGERITVAEFTRAARFYVGF